LSGLAHRPDPLDASVANAQLHGGDRLARRGHHQPRLAVEVDEDGIGALVLAGKAKQEPDHRVGTCDGAQRGATRPPPSGTR